MLCVGSIQTARSRARPQDKLGCEQKALLAAHGEEAGRLVEFWRGEAEAARRQAGEAAALSAETGALRRDLLAARDAVLTAQAAALAARGEAATERRAAGAAAREAAALGATVEALRAELAEERAAAGLGDGPLTAAGVVAAVGANAFATPAFEALTGLRWARPAGAPPGVHVFTHAATGFAFQLSSGEGPSAEEELAFDPLNAAEAGVAALLPPALAEGCDFPRAQLPLLLGKVLVALGQPR